MSNYITEAFKKFNLLESEDISLNAAGIEELRSFMDEAGVDPDEEVIEIYDMNAQAEDELKQSYLGKAILECKVCHSYIFEDRKNIGTDVEGNCCTDIECPYCLSTDGFIVIGEVAPYNESESEELIDAQKDDEDDLPDVNVEGAADEIEEEDFVEESLDDQEAYDDEHKDEAEEKIDESLTEGCDKDDLEEGMKLDGVEELYDNDEIRGVEEIEGDEKLEGDDRIRGDKHKAPINEGLNDSYTVTLDVASEEETPEAVIQDLKINSNMPETISAEVLKMIGPGGGWPLVKFVGPKEDLIAFTTEYINEDAEAFIEPLNESCNSKKVNEGCDSEKIDESIEDVSVTTEDEVMTMATKDDGGVVIETTPKEDVVDDFSMSGEEMIVPMSDESSEEVEAAVDANSIEDGEEDETFDDIESEMSEDEFAIDDFDEFDEESFNGLGESYLKSCYENVTGFKTTGVSTNKNKLFIEGIIKFDSGNEKKTNFVFESVGNHKFEGYNEQISRGKKTFKLNSSVDNKKLVCESLNYNYRSKNELNESVRVYGTVKRK